MYLGKPVPEGNTSHVEVMCVVSKSPTYLPSQVDRYLGFKGEVTSGITVYIHVKLS